ncbi:MAG: hypothetical protein D6769_00940 [Methanobacteriota archaeon]|nr:MAG: hypothetical protein D6769_00940 [Euryarchaeota archaeon]
MTNIANKKAVSNQSSNSIDAAHIASLARIDMGEEELSSLTNEMEELLQYFSAISKYEGEGKTHILNVLIGTRQDKSKEDKNAGAIREQFSSQRSGFVKVPRGLKK